MRRSLINNDVVRTDLTQDPYAGSHGASRDHLGAGVLYYALAHLVRSQVSVCLGSGGGFVPSLMRRAQLDAGFEPAATYLVDANLPELAFGSPGAQGGWFSRENDFANREQDVVFLPMLTVDAARLFATQNLQIDYLHIDADHSKEGAIRDFETYAPLLSEFAVVTLHDVSMPSLQAALDVLQARFTEWQRLDFTEVGAGTAVMRRRFLAKTRRPGSMDAFLDRERRVVLDLSRAQQAFDESRERARFERWAYLRSKTYQLRYRLLCEYVDCEEATLLEVGGYPNSVVDYVRHAKRVHLIEPYAPPAFQNHVAAIAKAKGCEVLFHPQLLSQLQLRPEALGKYRFVMAGLDITSENGGIKEMAAALRGLAGLMAGAQQCAVEIPHYAPSQVTWEALLELLEPELTLDVTLDLSQDPVADEYHVKDNRAKRRIVVFKPPPELDLDAAPKAAHILVTAQRLMDYRTKTQSAEEPWYIVGTPIDFSKEGQSSLYTRGGWRGPERTLRWATHEESTLCFLPLAKPGVPHPPTPLRAELSLKPFLVPGKIEAQRLRVYVNGTEVYQGSIAAEQSLLINIPEDLAFSGNVLRVVLVHPDAGVPAELVHGSTDRAQLALAVRHLRISAKGL